MINLGNIILGMPPDLQDPLSIDNMYRVKHESWEDQYDTSPKGGNFRYWTNHSQERNTVSGFIIESIVLERTKYGYQLDKLTKINNLFDVDDLKLAVWNI